MDEQGALGAGFMLVLTTAALAAAGAFLGSAFDARFIGGLAGGVLGVILGFYLVWRRFVVPANEADKHRDYSKVRKLEDDDDDDW